MRQDERDQRLNKSCLNSHVHESSERRKRFAPTLVHRGGLIYVEL